MMKADILKQREMHRGDAEGVALNFLVNYSYPAKLMRLHLPPQEGKEDIFQAAKRAYVIGIAACVETFFRDLFVHFLKHNPGMLDRALKESIRSESAKRLPQYLAEGVSAEEFAAAASFQNGNAIDHNISIAFSGWLRCKCTIKGCSMNTRISRSRQIRRTWTWLLLRDDHGTFISNAKGESCSVSRFVFLS